VSAVLARVQHVVQFGHATLTSIDQKGFFGDTPLIVVASWKDLAAARLLLDAGANVNAKGEDGDTALHRAAAYDDVELANLLVERGAAVAEQNDCGDTALDVAVRVGSDGIVELLKETCPPFDR